MELTQALLLISILLEAGIILLLAVIYTTMKKAIMESQSILKNTGIAKDALERLDRLYDELRRLRNDIAVVSVERIGHGKGASNTRVETIGNYEGRVSVKEEDSGIQLDITHPAVRQWYEYLKKLEEEKKKKKSSKR